MSRIRILPEQIANRIAAGEVVERPASVVKELIENSLDAGSDRIEVEVEGNGSKLLRIIDNGEGMDEDDVLLSLERHGTSKIRSDDDLAAISSLGFRGEALPSIASVSRMTVTSRQSGSDLGTQVIMNYGKLLKAHQVGCPIGTTIEIHNLFGNTPARRKFLRTARTELGHIEEIIKNYCLGARNVSFILRINNRESIHLEKGLSLQQRLSQIMNYGGEFMEVSLESGNSPAMRSITGYLIPPDKEATGTRGLKLFVNGRAVKDRLMTHAVAEGLRGFLMKGKNPVGFLELQLPAEEVDVNVHPAKHEVRFHHSRDIHQLISRAVAEAMRNRQQQMQNAIFGNYQVREDEPAPIEEPKMTGAPLAATTPVKQRKQTTFHTASKSPSQGHIENKPKQPTTTVASETFHDISANSSPIVRKNLLPNSISEKKEFDQPPPRKHLRVLGQYQDLYIFCQAGDNLLIIDQHAAHERLLYEKLKKQYMTNKVTSQSLLFPVTIELSVSQAQLVEQNIDEISALGFQIRDFGSNSFVISSVPALAGQCEPSALFIDILARFGEDKRRVVNDKGRMDDILASMACKAAVKSGDHLHDKEIDNLLEQMAQADLFSHCPHGRPVVKEFSEREVKKWFHRT